MAFGKLYEKVGIYSILSLVYGQGIGWGLNFLLDGWCRDQSIEDLFSVFWFQHPTKRPLLQVVGAQKYGHLIGFLTASLVSKMVVTFMAWIHSFTIPVEIKESFWWKAPRKRCFLDYFFYRVAPPIIVSSFPSLLVRSICQSGALSKVGLST